MNKRVVLYICFFFILVVLLIITHITLSKRIVDNKYNGTTTNQTKVKDISDPITLDGDYVKNQVIISFDKSVSEADIKSTINSIKELNKSESLFDNTYVLTINVEFDSRNDLNNFCKNLVSNTKVSNCEANNIIRLDDCTKGPC